MGKNSRRRFTAEFKARVAIEALREQSTLATSGHRTSVTNQAISADGMKKIMNLLCSMEYYG